MNRDTCEKLLAAYRTAVKNDEDAIAKMLFEVMVDVMSDVPPLVQYPTKQHTGIDVPRGRFGNPITVDCAGVDVLSDAMRCEG